MREQVAYLNNALAGLVVERAGGVTRVALLYDMLTAEALSPRASVDKVTTERWPCVTARTPAAPH